MLFPEAVWKSVVSVRTEDRSFLRATRFSTWRSRSVSLCGLPLSVWAVVAPRYFHFTITALTVDRGISSRAEIWRTDFLERWHPMTVPRWKPLSSSVWPFYCQCLSMEIALQCAGFYTPVSNGVVEISKSTNLKWCPHTFVYIVYMCRGDMTHNNAHTHYTAHWMMTQGSPKSPSRHTQTHEDAHTHTTTHQIDNFFSKPFLCKWQLTSITDSFFLFWLIGLLFITHRFHTVMIRTYGKQSFIRYSTAIYSFVVQQLWFHVLGVGGF
jgi:hypothetical protein